MLIMEKISFLEFFEVPYTEKTHCAAGSAKNKTAGFFSDLLLSTRMVSI